MDKFITLLITALLCCSCSPAFAADEEIETQAFYDNVTVNQSSVDDIADAVMSRILEYVQVDEEYTVTFITNTDEISMAAQTVTSWYEVNFAVPEHEAYEFVGFFADPQYTTPFILGSNELDSNATIYLSYEKVPLINFVDPLGETFTPCYANDINLPVIVPPEGHEFLGWFTDSECSQAFNVQESVIDDISLYAGYKYLPMITPVSEFEELTPYRITDTIELPELNHPAGYVFAGWYYDEAATQRLSPSDTLTDDVTIYANYVEQGTMGDFFTTLLDSFTQFFADESVKYLVSIVFLVIVIAMLRVWIKYTR